MISTYPKDNMRVVVNKADRVQSKPVVVCDYNVNMLGVDLKNQMLQPYLLERTKSTKWYLKLFKRLLNVAIHYAMVVYQCLPNNKNMDTLKFRLSLAQGLVGKHCSAVPRPVYGHQSLEPLPKRLTERHFLERIPATGKKAKPQKICIVCSKHGRRKESIYWCSECEAGLCLNGCFKKYHTTPNF
jgi:hypothetical protein